MMKHQSLTKRKKVNAYLFSLPLLVFTIIFILGPLIYLLVLSFSQTKGVSGILFEFSFGNYKRIWESTYRTILTDSLFIGVSVTVFVALLGYPFGYFLSRLSKKWQARVQAFLMVPFWVSSLLRLYGWIIIFRNNGILDKLLLKLHIIKEPLRLLYTRPATIVGMIYALLPMMIFSVYSSAEKLDWRLVEASRDLGATAKEAFTTVIFPLTLPGLFSGVILTFIPSMGLIFIAELLGGNRIMLIGNLINEQATIGHNIPFAAALSVIFMLLIGIMIVLYKKIFRLGELEGII